MVCALCEFTPALVQAEAARLCPAVLLSIDDTDPVVLPPVWEAVLHVVSTIPVSLCLKDNLTYAMPLYCQVFCNVFCPPCYYSRYNRPYKEDLILTSINVQIPKQMLAATDLSYCFNFGSLCRQKLLSITATKYNINHVSYLRFFCSYFRIAGHT